MTATPRQPSWGLPEAGLAWVVSQMLALVGFVGILTFGDWSPVTPVRPGGHLGRAAGQLASGVPLEDDSVPLVWTMLSLLPLWAGLLGVSWLAAAARGRARTGWRLQLRPRDLPVGVAAGLLLQVPLIPLLYLVVEAIFGEIQPSGRALALTDQVDTAGEIIMIVAFVAVGAPVVEELFYRGLVQRSLVERFGPGIGIAAAAGFFGAVHFSWVELPALVLVGLVLGVLAWRAGRLGPAVIGHVTFNLITLVNLLAAAD